MANRTRKHEMKYRLNDKEYEQFRRKVKKTGLSQQAFITKAINGAELMEQPPVDFFEVLNELRRISMRILEINTAIQKSGKQNYMYEIWDCSRMVMNQCADLIQTFIHFNPPERFR